MPGRLYSERLGRISERQLQAALNHFQLGHLVRAEPIPHGHFGQNLFLTSTTGAYVLRGNPNYPGQFEAERFYAEALTRRTRTPAPWPYQIDATTGIFGWSYVVMPRMAGLQLSDPAVRDRLEPVQISAIAGALGRNLAEAHTLTWDRPGRYHPVTDAVGPLEPADGSVWSLPAPDRLPAGPAAGAPYARWVAGRVRARLRTAREHSPTATTAADLAWADAVMAGSERALAEPFQPCLVVEDYKEGNLVVTCEDGRWEVSGIFDLAQAYFGDGESDLARTLCSYLDEDAERAAAFLGAYLAARPPRPGFPQRAAAYLLLDRAMLWEFFQRRGLRWWPATWTFSDWAGRYLSLASPVLSRATGTAR